MEVIKLLMEKSNGKNEKESMDDGINSEWIRIVEVADKKKVSIKEAKKIFKDGYKKKFGIDYESQ